MLSECCTHLTHRGMWDPTPFGVVASYHFALSKTKWIQYNAAQLISPQGRCFSFDASASGMTRGETTAAICVKALVQMVDGSPVMNEAVAEGLVGTLAGSSINQSGRRASLSSPDGAAEQEAMAMACRNAYISPLDVDAVECHANGNILADAVETSSTARAYRPDGKIGIEETAPLGILASKTRTGDFCDAVGLVAILQVMSAMKTGACMPICHLRILNPHIDISICERPANMSVEILETRLPSAFTGVSAHSFSGTNVHFLTYGQVNEDTEQPQPDAEQSASKKITYWPEGGGKLETEHLPRSGYSIVGSWSRFEPQNMEDEGSGVYGYTITLGENRWEHFQIWLDGQKQKALHPGELKAGKHSTVLGPEETLTFNTWIVDGRPVWMWKSPGPVGSLTDRGQSGGWEQIEVETGDHGQVGDKYRIRLRLSGKFRTVEWEKLKEKAALAEIPRGRYYVVGSWSNLDFEEMACEDEVAGVFSREVQVPSTARCDFFIVRDKDWMQVFYPSTSDSEDALGPEPMQNTAGTWSLRQAYTGDVFKIKFSRRIDATDSDSPKVCWEKVAKMAPLRQEIIDRQNLPVFSLVGSWDWTGSMKMNWTGEFFQFFVELGEAEQVSFTILKENNLDGCFYPSIADASLGDKYTIVGPVRARKGMYHWTIGKETWSGRSDDAARGKRYEIKVFVENEVPVKVAWSSPKVGSSIEDALIRGFLAYGQ